MPMLPVGLGQQSICTGPITTCKPLAVSHAPNNSAKILGNSFPVPPQSQQDHSSWDEVILVCHLLLLVISTMASKSTKKIEISVNYISEAHQLCALERWYGPLYDSSWLLWIPWIPISRFYPSMHAPIFCWSQKAHQLQASYSCSESISKRKKKQRQKWLQLAAMAASCTWSCPGGSRN